VRLKAIGRGRFGIGFQRHLATGGHVERPPAGRDDPIDLPGIEERRRAAAEVDRIGLCRHSWLFFLFRPSRLPSLSGPSYPSCPSCLPCPSRPLDFSDERFDVTLLERHVEQTSIEVAIVANGGTERD